MAKSQDEANKALRVFREMRHQGGHVRHIIPGLPCPPQRKSASAASQGSISHCTTAPAARLPHQGKFRSWIAAAPAPPKPTKVVPQKYFVEPPLIFPPSDASRKQKKPSSSLPPPLLSTTDSSSAPNFLRRSNLYTAPFFVCHNAL